MIMIAPMQLICPTILPILDGGGGVVFNSSFQPVEYTGAVLIPDGALYADIYAIGAGQTGFINFGAGGKGGWCVGVHDVALAGHTQLYCSLGEPGGTSGAPGGDTVFRYDNSSGTMILRAKGGASASSNFPASPALSYAGGNGGTGSVNDWGGNGGSAGNTAGAGSGGDQGGTENINGLLTCGYGGIGGLTGYPGGMGVYYGSGGGGSGTAYDPGYGAPGMGGIRWKGSTGGYIDS